MHKDARLTPTGRPGGGPAHGVSCHPYKMAAPLRAEGTGAAGALQEQRSLPVKHWLHHYNRASATSALKSRPPISSLKMEGNNLLMLHS